MQKHNRFAPVIIVILALAAGMIFVLSRTEEISLLSQKSAVGKAADKAVSDILEYDIHLYFIGTPPEGMEKLGDKMTVISPDKVSEDTMPVPWPMYPTTVYDEYGQVIKKVEPRYYARYMMIIISDIPEGSLSEEALEAIRTSVVDNGVMLIARGPSAIVPIREKLLLVNKTYDEHGTMFFASGTGAVDSPVDKEASAAGGLKLTEAFLVKWKAEIDRNIEYEKILESEASKERETATETAIESSDPSESSDGTEETERLPVFEVGWLDDSYGTDAAVDNILSIGGEDTSGTDDVSGGDPTGSSTSEGGVEDTSGTDGGEG